MPVLADRADRFKHRRHHLGREAKRRLVERQELRLSHQRAADGKHLLLAARHRAGGLRCTLMQSRKQREHPLKSLLAQRPCARIEGAEHQVFHHGEFGKYLAPLRRQADAGGDAIVRRHTRDIFALVTDRPLHQRDQAGHRPHGGGLAGAVSTEEADHLALRHA